MMFKGIGLASLKTKSSTTAWINQQKSAHWIEYPDVMKPTEHALKHARWADIKETLRESLAGVGSI